MMSRSTQHILLAMVLAWAVIAAAFCISLACLTDAGDHCVDGETIIIQGIAALSAVVMAALATSAAAGARTSSLWRDPGRTRCRSAFSLAIAPLRI